MNSRYIVLLVLALIVNACSSAGTTSIPVIVKGPYEHPHILIRTAKGDMIAELYEDKAPNTVANIISLAESGFYKGQRFHRVVKGFMAQGGCPNSKAGSGQIPGAGGPGYCIDNECTPLLHHDSRGILSMARTRHPNTNGSQFFLCFKPTPFLDGSYTVFGKVISGLEVMDQIEAIGADHDHFPPRELVEFDIQVIKKNDHPYTPVKNNLGY